MIDNQIKKDTTEIILTHQKKVSSNNPLRRFKSVVLAVIAINRMVNLSVQNRSVNIDNDLNSSNDNIVSKNEDFADPMHENDYSSEHPDS